MKITPFCLIAFFILSLNSAIAQPLKFGVMAGTDIHKVTGKALEEGFKFGYHLGLFAEIKLKSKVGLQPEVYFSQTNVENGINANSIIPNSVSGITKVRLSYMNIPVLLNLRPDKHFAVQLGPQFGILVNQNKSYLQSGEDAFKKGDVSAAAGLEINLLKLRLYGRYIIGLNDVNNIVGVNEKWKNQTIHIGIGYTFF